MEKKFASALIGALYYALDSLHVGVVVFSKDATLEIPLHNIENINALRSETESLIYTGTSNSYGLGQAFYSALFKIRQHCFSKSADRLGTANLAIIATASMPTTTPLIYQELDSLSKAGATIIAVGTNEVDAEFLREISSEGIYGNYFQAASFSEMSGFIQPILTRALDLAAGKV